LPFKTPSASLRRVFSFFAKDFLGSGKDFLGSCKDFLGFSKLFFGGFVRFQRVASEKRKKTIFKIFAPGPREHSLRIGRTTGLHFRA
jgi:hypothetical protein